MVAALLLLVVMAAPAPTVRNPINRSPAWETNSSSPTEDILTSWNTVLLEKLIGPQLVKKFPAMYGTRRFITEFTRGRHLSLSQARLIRSMPPPPPFQNEDIPAFYRSEASLCLHKRPPMTPVLNQTNPVHILSVSSWYISVLSFHSSLGRPTSLHHSGFLTKTQYEFLISPIHAYTRHNHFIFRGFITLKISGKKYKSWKLFLRNFLLVLLHPS